MGYKRKEDLINKNIKELDILRKYLTRRDFIGRPVSCKSWSLKESSAICLSNKTS